MRVHKALSITTYISLTVHAFAQFQPEPYRFVQQTPPFADGVTIQFIPGTTVDVCATTCQQYGPQCAGFVFKYKDASIATSASECTLKGVPISWRDDPYCGATGQLCQGYLKIIDTTRTPEAFEETVPNFLTGLPLPGFPAANLPYSRCVELCTSNPNCFAMTYKQANPAIAGDQPFCIISRYSTDWVADPRCGLDGSFCKGMKRRGSLLPGGSGGFEICPNIKFHPKFELKQQPYAYGPNLVGYPQLNWGCDRCVSTCQLDEQCVAAVYNEGDFNDPNSPSYCYLKSAVQAWGDAPECAVNGQQRCHGYSKKPPGSPLPRPEYCPAKPIPDFQLVVYPFIVGPNLPGYPKVGTGCETCIFECRAYGNACKGVMFKKADARFAGSPPVCTLKSRIDNYQSDPFCGKDGFELCMSWARKAIKK